MTGERTKQIGYYIAPEMQKQLDKAKRLVTKKDWDRVFIIDGSEGTGKSKLARDFACYVDPNMTLDRIVFSGEDFCKAIDEAPKFSAIIFDEAFNGLASSGALSKMNRMLVRKLQECRQKNLFIFIVLPTIFLLQTYAGIFRSQALFHVYSSKQGERGYYKAYNKLNKKLLYLSGKKMYNYAYPYIGKSHMFRDKQPLQISVEEYQAKKLAALKREEEEDVRIDKYYLKFAFLCKAVTEGVKLNQKQIVAYLKEHEQNISTTQISRILQEIAPKPPKIPKP